MLRVMPYKAFDAADIVRWVGDERQFRQWSADRYESWPITAQDMNDYYGPFGYEHEVYPFTVFEGTVPVGHFTLRWTDRDRRVLRLGFVIVDGSRRGQGLGRELVGLAAKLAFGLMGARKLTLGVFENNEAARRCYLAAGFREVEVPQAESYQVLGEDWKCVEMELGPEG